MSEIEISSAMDSEPDIDCNMDMFQQMINLCRNNKKFPQTYVEDMNKMYKKCDNKQKNSKHLCSLVLKGIELISPKNKDSFQHAANVYNALLQLTKKDYNPVLIEECIASTSNGNDITTSELENGTSNNEISESDKIFKELIEKCYQNINFPNLNIEAIDKLYNSLPSEFLSSKYFIKLLREANQVIWPDSGINLYTHLEHIYDQLQQFKTSMKVQDSRTFGDNDEMSRKKSIQLKKLKTVLKVIRKKIKMLDEEEMDINNDDEFSYDSAYLLKDKYEKRIVEIYKRMCKLNNEPDFLEEPVLRFKATNDSLVNKTIEKWYNINKTFPDYFEIYTLLKCLQEKKNLKWTETELKNISQDAFLKLGKQLKLQRLNDYFGRLANASTMKDPAEENEDLRKKLDESNKKLHADLNMLTKKYENKQNYAEETEGSNLNDTECEYSSENEYSDNDRKLNKKAKPILIKRKRVSESESESESVSESESEHDKQPKKSQKTMYMESFNLAPIIVTEKVPNQITVIDNVDDTINKNNIIDIVKDADKISKNTNDIMSNGETNNVNRKASNKIYIKKVSEDVLKIVDANTDESNNLVTERSLADTDADGILVIDEDINVKNGTVTKEPLENKIREVDSEESAMNHSTISIDSEVKSPIEGIEPEVIIKELHKDKDSSKDVIEINELDDSDLEITCETPKVPVQNKKSLQNIIESLNFDKQYSWKNDSKNNSKNVNSSPSHTSHQNPNNSNQNLNQNFVNCWIMNNVQPSRPNSTNNVRPFRPNSTNNVRPRPNSTYNVPNIRNNNRYQRMQSTSIQNNVQTARQFTQRISNTVQQQRNQVTTMTTTTTVRQIVQKNQVRRPTMTNNGKKPELIELD
ncbi:death domain-associated protein 6-like isoform X2 [Rhopalosiphum padi]|uniref:death domain-associated protein 6-like isoform X2 n=1 Tax=Rhopalosiphum padi TaxID=40932 RepID=UPI00298DF15D|nr:death domain-associated protein 6-like isoform X2 [Rhopalosiphum padi]